MIKTIKYRALFLATFSIFFSLSSLQYVQANTDRDKQFTKLIVNLIADEKSNTQDDSIDTQIEEVFNCFEETETTQIPCILKNIKARLAKFKEKTQKELFTKEEKELTKLLFELIENTQDRHKKFYIKKYNDVSSIKITREKDSLLSYLVVHILDHCRATLTTTYGYDWDWENLPGYIE